MNHTIIEQKQGLTLRLVTDREAQFPCGRLFHRKQYGNCGRTPALAVSPDAGRLDVTDLFLCVPCARQAGWLIDQSTKREPRSMGGDLNITRRCWRGEHTGCTGSWTQYPDKAGACECNCHGARS